MYKATVLFYKLFWFFLNSEVVNVCDSRNTFIKVLPKRPKKRDVKGELAHATDARVSVL